MDEPLAFSQLEGTCQVHGFFRGGGGAVFFGIVGRLDLATIGCSLADRRVQLSKKAVKLSDSLRTKS